jgi:serine/threonine protein kinase
MSLPLSDHPSSSSVTLDLEQLVDSFEQAWQSGRPPRIEQFLPTSAEAPRHREILEELVKIDLEYRWRQAQPRDADLPPCAGSDSDFATALDKSGVPQHPRLEDYVARYPELGPLDQLSVDLIGEEYMVRQQWGDRPSQTQYLARFLHQAERLREKLARLDAEIPSELAPRSPETGTFTVGEHAGTKSWSEFAWPASPTPALICPSCGKSVESPAGATVRVAAPPRTSPGGRAERSGDEPVIPGYVILGELGRGGMGVVYKARQMALQRLVALKMILADQAGMRELQRFRREAEAVAQLQHPHIVQVYEVGEQAGRPYISFEYVEGGNLAQKLSGTPQLPAPSAQLVEILARAIHVAHHRGIIHRDLKPGNVLLARNNSPQAVPLGENAEERERYEPKITDFGLVKRLDNEIGQTQTGEIMGTPTYMAPEQASGRTKDIGPAVDVYALGAILYELLTGRPPFRGATTLDTLDLVRTQEPVPPRRLQPKLPRDLETICLKCLRKEPHQRYASGEALAEDLRRFRAGEPIQARPVGSVERMWRWSRRKPLVASLSAALMLVFLTGFAGVVWQWRLAEHQRVRADQSFREARQAVDDYLIKITESKQLSDPSLAALRKDLLHAAQKYYQDFLERRGGDPALQAELATTSSRLASIHLQNHEQKEAAQFARQALELRQQLVDASPASIPGRRDLAASHDQLATVQGYAAQTTESLDNYEKARALRKLLIQESPDDPELQNDLAATYFNTALVLRRAGQRTAALDALDQAGDIWARLVHFHAGVAKYQHHLAKNYGSIANVRYETEPDLALRDYQQALKLFVQLTREHPAVFEYQVGLAATHHNIGWLLYQKNELAPALQSNESARQIREGLVRSTMVQLQNDLASSYTNVGMLQHDTGQAAQALESLQQARAIREELLQRPPQSPFVRSDLGATLGELGRVLTRLGRPQDALTVFHQAVAQQREAVAKAPKIVEFQQRLLEHYLGLVAAQRALGRSAEADATFLEFQKSASGRPEVLYKAAHNFALRASRMDGSKKELTPEERAERERYVDQAVQALHQAVANGFRDGKRLQQDESFESLRSREDFQKLLQQLAKAGSELLPK